MKRTYDNSVSGGQFTSAGQISAGMTATKESIYMNTNMVNIQREDHTNVHGIETFFTQTRVLPIVGKTSRADIALKSVDVQTKTLPIFQPQVQIGTDINRLIYEIGLSSTWRNSLLQLPADGSCIASLLDDEYGTVDGDLKPNTWAPSTFQNSSTASLPMIDSYNTITTLSLIPSGVKDTLLSILFDYWNNKSNLTIYPSLRTTCLTPVVVGSGCEKILNVTSAAVGGLASALVVNVKSTDGFSIGDRVRFFGIINSFTPQTKITDVYATVYDVVSDLGTPQASFLNLTSPAIIFDYQLPGEITGRVLQLSPPFSNPTNVWFEVRTDAYQIGQVLALAQPPGGPPTDPRLLAVGTITVASVFPYGVGYAISANLTINWSSDNPDALSLNPVLLATPFAAEDGYVINQTVKDGGHIELLTDEFEFQPVTMNGMSDSMLTANQLKLTNPLLPTNDFGFWRGFGNGATQAFTSPVQISVKTAASGQSPQVVAAITKLINGYYRITARFGSTVYYTPLSKTFPVNGQDLTQWTFEMKLAPNYYTLDTQADELIDPTNTTSKYSFMRALGYTITDTLPIQTPTYPPTATAPTKTWTRAYTVSWDFSAYRNLIYVPQDLTASLPRPPLQQQDFGGDSGATTYYNVYEINKFLNDCVNLGIERTINDTVSEIANLGAFSLNSQLAVAFNAYSALLKFPAENFLWSSTANYVLGDLAVTGDTSAGLAFVAVKASPGPIPRTPVSTTTWYFLGNVPYQTGETIPYALCLKFGTTTGVVYPFQYMTAGIENGIPGRDYSLVSQINVEPVGSSSEFLPFSTIIPVPVFTTKAPTFYYNDSSPSLLSSLTYDGYGFGTNSVNQTNLSQDLISLYTYKRTSWGNQGASNADEWLVFESNTSFKFLMDNFPGYCTAYEDTLAELRTGTTFPFVNYWVWDNSKPSFDPRTGDSSFEIYQTSESMSACMSPVQSIVVVGNNIPVLEELASPVSYLVDSDSSAFTNRSETISLTQKIIGEVFPQWMAPYNSRSITRFEMDVLHYNALLDTKLFKQLEYSLYYRHRITQELIPLVLSNYGSVNIKFVFRPIS